MTQLPRSVLFACLFVLSQTAAAATVSLDPVKTGVFARSGLGFGAAAYTAVRYSPTATALTFLGAPNFPNWTTGFAVFDLAGLGGTVTGATFEGTLGAGSTNPPVSFMVNRAMTAPAAFDRAYDDCTPLATCRFVSPPVGLLTPGGFAIYDDLTGGTLLASFGFPTGGTLPATRTADLNPAGVGVVQGALGGKLVLGINFLALGTFTLDSVRLNVSTVPVPPALLLFGPAFGALVLRRRRDAR